MLAGAQRLKEELDQARGELEIAQRERRSEPRRRADVRRHPEPREKQLAEAEAAKEHRMLNEEVTEDSDIAPWSRAGPASRSTRCWRASARSCSTWKTCCASRVIGQEEAIVAVDRQRGAPCARRPAGPEPADRLFRVPRPHRRRQDRADQGARGRFLFDDETAMVRLDMSEYMEKHAVARMIGAPPGYVGYEEGGALTEAVRRRPYQVVLFDEVEKAHPDVFNILLQVLDDGRLTDGQGRTIDFRNTMIILTSNLGAEILAAQPEGEDSDAVRGQVMEVVRAAFRPEFLNRLDEVLLFHRLTRPQMTGIVDIQLARLLAMLAERKITLELDEPAKTWLADRGYDPVYGARPLKRVIQRELQNPLASLILEGKIGDGDTVNVSAGAEGLAINGEMVAAA